jgi:putative iron-regulated protein
MQHKLLPFFIGASMLAFTSCSKSNKDDTQTNSDATLELKVMTDFANVVANPDYTDLQNKAGLLKTAVTTLVATPTDANLLAAQTAWKNTRAPWEACEGFLFGPVEDYNYDPTMDSWPVDKNELDAILASNNQLGLTDIDALSDTQKGFHAIEYIIFGLGGTQKAANITAREKLYLTSLTQSLYNTTVQLQTSWATSGGNYTKQVITAGSGSTVFTSRKDLFVALVGSMADICDEVSTSKMQTPLVAQDSLQDESAFSHNSVADFKNNITGIYNAYMCTYNGATGTGLNQIVAAKNAALDLKLRTQMLAAIASFSTITTTYEKAIYTNQSQIKAVQATINTLHDSLDGDLKTFINTNIKD